MGFPGYLQGAWLTLPYCIYQLVDVAFCIYKFTLRDLGTLGSYGYHEYATVLAFGLVKFPVAVFIICVWLRTKCTNNLALCGDDAAQNEWDKMNDFNDVPKLITALCNIPLLICNIRILANALQAGLEPSFVWSEFYNSLVTVLYISIAGEVIVESIAGIWRVIKAFRACQSAISVLFRITELGVLCLAFFSLRIGYDLQMADSGMYPSAPDLSIVAMVIFGLGFFYATVNLWIDRATLVAQDQVQVYRYTGCTTNCNSDSLECLRPYVTTVVVMYLSMSCIMCAFVMGENIPPSGSVFNACVVGAIILSVVAEVLLMALVVISCYSAASGDQDGQGASAPVPMPMVPI